MILALLAVINGFVPINEVTKYDAVGAFAVPWRLGLSSSPDPATNDHNWYCAAVLVSPNTIYTAKHCVDAYGADQSHAVRFRRKPDGTVGTIEQGVNSFYHVFVQSWNFPGGDIAIGHLRNTVTHIQPIPIWYNYSVTEPAPIQIAGWGKEEEGGIVRRLKVCDTQTTYGDQDFIYFLDVWHNNCGPYNNDSGSPLLITTHSGTYVIGITFTFNGGSRIGPN